MDNKKWGKRFSTIFWWTLTILPLIIALIYFIGYHFTFNSGITSATDLASYHVNVNGSYLDYLSEICFNNEYSFITFDPLCLPFIKDMFSSLFSTLDIDYYDFFPVLFSWMASVQLYHVMYDVCVWIFRIIHSWLERWC